MPGCPEGTPPPLLLQLIPDPFSPQTPLQPSMALGPPWTLFPGPYICPQQRPSVTGTRPDSRDLGHVTTLSSPEDIRAGQEGLKQVNVLFSRTKPSVWPAPQGEGGALLSYQPTRSLKGKFRVWIVALAKHPARQELLGSSLLPLERNSMRSVPHPHSQTQ